MKTDTYQINIYPRHWRARLAILLRQHDKETVAEFFAAITPLNDEAAFVYCLGAYPIQTRRIFDIKPKLEVVR